MGSSYVRYRLFGVDISDATMAEALAQLEGFLRERRGCPRSVYFANAHTLNHAHSDPAYRAVLGRADEVFGDGVGVRWGVRIVYGARLRDNVNGSDFVPHFLGALGGKGYRLYMLGTTPSALERAVRHVRSEFPGWTLVGHHHGYVDLDGCHDLVAEINASGADLLLVAMGNPRQERWIDAHRDALTTPLCMGVGGLFTYWAGDLTRAPGAVRRAGLEWLYLITRQPEKLPRHAIGDPLFLARAMVQRARGER